MTRFFIAATLAVLVSSGGTAGAAKPADFSGTWNVTTTSLGGTCPDQAPSGETASFIWLVSTTPAGAITVSVQGKTSFPNLAGTANGGTALSVSALGNKRSANDVISQKSYADYALFELRREGNALVGTRMYLSLAAMEGNLTPCFVRFSVRATR